MGLPEFQLPRSYYHVLETISLFLSENRELKILQIRAVVQLRFVLSFISMFPGFLVFVFLWVVSEETSE